MNECQVGLGGQGFGAVDELVIQEALAIDSSDESGLGQLWQRERVQIASEVVTLDGEEGQPEILEGSRRERETHKSESERECDVFTGIKRKKIKIK